MVHHIYLLFADTWRRWDHVFKSVSVGENQLEHGLKIEYLKSSFMADDTLIDLLENNTASRRTEKC